MNLVLYTRDELNASLSHGAILCTQEMANDYYLMHYRTKGSRNGYRRYQDENGRLTEEGYRHYAEMYGWNKKTNKARHLQDNADKAFQRSDKISRKLDKSTLDANVARSKANYEQAKNDRRTTERGQRRVEILNGRARKAEAQRDQLKSDLDTSLAKARLTQDKATDYNNKLARKDERMSKYVDEHGNLNEKALEKYTYTTGIPGERKMSLVGRLKFGNEYTKKFNDIQAKNTTEELRKQLGDKTNDIPGDQKSLEKAWTESEKQRFDKESREERIDRAVEENDLNAISKEADRRLAERGNKKPSLNESVAEMEKIRDEAYLRSEKRDPQSRRESDIAYYFGDKGWNKYRQEGVLSDFAQGLDNLSVSQRKRLGNGLLDCLDTVGKEVSDKIRRGEKVNRDDYSEYNTMSEWLTEEIYERSGSWNAGEFKTGSKAKPAYDKMMDASDKMDAHAESVKKKLGLTGNAYWFSTNPKDKASAKLRQALDKDDVWKSMNKAYNDAEKDLCGAILQDLGFPDNSANRSIIIQYAFID